MSSGIGLSLDTSFLQSLDEVDKKIKAISEGTNAISKKTIAAFQLMARNGVMPYVEQLEKQKKALEEIEKAAGKGTVMTSVKNEAKAAVDEINKVIDALKKTSAFRGEQSGRSAMSFANSVLSGRGEVKSISNLQLALSQLEEAQNRVNLKTKTGRINYQKIGETIKQVKRELDEVTSSAKGTSGIISGLFSLNAIRSFISRLKEIRGEFEMQHRSLQVLLQDVDKANELWDKTVSLAVRSPFRVKELVTYTKQLAAYRVEADKLYDTNRMLADVSAGLGVDMNRLILAFGQVKAANFLRGTELRQFSEAGVNMLEELAKRFTELEGRAVSVGDVFERVSKRMVSFADVEAVFQRITSEGGAFYQMQERQSETLKGMLSNLQDSIDLMFNNIGQANDGVIKSVVQGIKALVDNWESVSSVALPVLSMMVARWRIFGHLTAENGKGILGFAKNLGKDFGIVATQLTKGKKAAQGMVAVGKTLSMSWVSAITAILAVLGTLYGVIRNITKVSRELTKIDLKGGLDASQAIAEYKRLSEIVRDSSKSYDEQQKALSILKTKYGEILPSHLLEAKTIREIGDNYEGATEAIKDYIATKTKEKQISFISTEYGKDVEAQASDLVRNLKNALAKVAPSITRSDVLPIVNRLRELIESGDVDATNVDSTLQKLVREFTGLDIATNAWKYTMGTTSGQVVTWNNNALALVNSMTTLKTKIDEVTSSSLSFQDSFINKDFNRVKDEYEKQSKAIGDYYDAIRLYNKELESKGVDNIDPKLATQYDEALKSLNSIFAEAGKEAPKWNEIINEPFKLNEATIDANKILWQKMIDTIEEMPVLPSQAAAKSGYIETLEREMNSFAGGQKQQEIARVAQGLADTMKVSLKDLDELFLGSEESLSDYAKKISEVLNEYKRRLLLFDNDVKKGTNFSDLTKDNADLIKEQIPFLEKYLEYFEAFLKQPEKAPKDTFTPMLRSVTELYEEFKRLQGSFDDLTAKEGALAKFGDAFKEAFGKTPEEMGFDLFSEEGAKKAYDYLISQAPDAQKKIQAQLAKGEIVWDVKLEAKKDADEKLLDDVQKLFDRYDLSLELKNLNIPSELAKSLFDVDYLDLEGLKKAVQDQEAKFIGTDMEDEYKKLLEKIGDMEDKAAKERMETYVKYLQEGMSERVKLKIEELRKLKEIEESDEFTPEQKDRIKEGVSKKAREEQHKQEWKDFQGTEMYTMMFEDLEHYGSAAIDALYKKLSELKTSLSDLPASEVKEIVGQIEKLENIQIEKNPFEYLKKYKKEVKNIGFSEDELQTMLLGEQSKEETAQGIIDIIRLIQQEGANGQATLDIIESLSPEQLQSYSRLLTIQQQTGKALDDIADSQQDIVEDSKEQQGVIIGNLKSYKRLSKSQEESLELTQEWLNQVGNLFSASKDLMESLGVESDSVAMTIADTGSSMVSLTLSAIQFTLQLQAMGVAANSALGIIGWIAIAIQAVATVLSAIFSAKDKALQKEIDGHLARAEKLHERYEELSDAIDSAYDASVVRQFNKEIAKTIQLEIKAIEAAIAAEKAQKASKIDWGWVDEQEKKVKELYNTLNEEHDSYIERWGGFGSDEARFDFIESMTQAWLDSFKETGEGLAGLEEKWDEYFDNLVMKQMALRVSKAAIDNYLNMWDKYVSEESAGGEDLTEAEAEELRLEKERLLKDLSEKYTNLAESLGVTPTTEGGGLSGLQKGIQGITEDTAQIIEAYMNSIRGYVSEQVTYTKRLYEMFDRMSRGNTYGLNVRMIS